MTTECYYGGCKYHGSKSDPEEGPFCFEEECKATQEEIVGFQLEREIFLRDLKERMNARSNKGD